MRSEFKFHDYAEAGIFVEEIRTPRYTPFNTQFFMVGEDLAGTALTGSVRVLRDEADGSAPLISLTATGTNVAASPTSGAAWATWQDLVDDDDEMCDFTLDDIPDCFEPVDAVTVASLQLTANKTDIMSLPKSDNEGSNAIFEYDVKETSPAQRILLAGSFIVIAGVTQQ